jgi:diguanylate cyclase (GGDEF)-like protein/PAS domain S-box-containing protein
VIERAQLTTPPDARVVLDRLGYAVMLVLPDGEIVSMTDTVAGILGYPGDQVVGMNATDIVHPHDLHLLVEARDHVVAQPGPYAPLGCRFRDAAGNWAPVEFVTLGVDQHRPECFVIAFRSQAERLMLDEPGRLLAEGFPLPEVLHAVANAMGAGVVGLPATLLWERHDGRFCSAVHSQQAAAIGDAVDEVLLDSEELHLWDANLEPHSAVSTFRAEQLPAGVADRAAELGIPGGWAAPIGPGSGVPTGMVLLWGPGRGPRLKPAATARLSSLRQLAQLAFDRERYEQQLLHAAAHDPLTGLMNRARFFGVLERQTRRSAVAVLYVDLDLFKPVNDRYGHLVGDEVLVEVARRIEDVVRPTDVVARLGGDEFAVLCTDGPGEEILRRIAGRLLDALRVPVGTSAGPITVGASVGMASAPAQVDADRVVEAADNAVHQVKLAGRGQALLATPAQP